MWSLRFAEHTIRIRPMHGQRSKWDPYLVGSVFSEVKRLTIVGLTLTVVNDSRRFLSQLSTNFHEILHTLFSIHVTTTLKV